MARSSPGVLRAAAILNFIAAHPGQSFTLTDLVRALKLSRATCHSLLTALVEVGYLYRASDRNYVLGPQLATIGKVAAQHNSSLLVAEPELRALADRFDAICGVYSREKNDLVLRYRAASVSHVGWSVPVGTRVKLRPPFGSIYYAWSPEKEAKAWLDTYVPAPTAEHRDAMMKDMVFVRENGFQIHIRNANVPDLEEDPGRVFEDDRMSFPTKLLSELEDTEVYPVSGISAPVFRKHDQIAYVLSLVGFNRPRTGAEIREMGVELRGACARISSYIMGETPQSFAAF